jgi:hypothetical protein
MRRQHILITLFFLRINDLTFSLRLILQLGLLAAVHYWRALLSLLSFKMTICFRNTLELIQRDRWINWLNFSSVYLCIRSRLTPLRRVGFLGWGVFRFVLGTRLAQPIIRMSVEVVALGKNLLLSRLFLTISWILLPRNWILLLTLQVLVLGLQIWVTN